MIERDFQTGVRFNWMPPRQVPGPTDGAVIDSPQQILNAIIYDGMNAELLGPVHAGDLPFDPDVRFRRWAGQRARAAVGSSVALPASGRCER